MNENNEKKIKEMMEKPPVPDELSPDNIRKMLDEKAPAKKRNSIRHMGTRIAAGAAACAVIGSLAAFSYNRFKPDDFKSDGASDINTASESSSETSKTNSDKKSDDIVNTAYMNSAGSYDDLYDMLKTAADDYNKRINDTDTYGAYKGELQNGIALYEESAADAAAADGASSIAMDSAPTADTAFTANNDFSETYNQEADVLEADICKTDGRYIYYLYNDCDYEGVIMPCLNIAEAEDGKFIDTNIFNPASNIELPDLGEESQTEININDMYLYNGMLIVIGTANAYYYGDAYSCIDIAFPCGGKTFVNVYTTGIEPELLGSYTQDGSYNDVRIAPDGYMYLITNDSTENFNCIEEEENLEAYVPAYGCDGVEKLIPPEDILLPEDGIGECYSVTYTIVGGIDLTQPDSISEVDVKAITGFSGQIYCSASNLYTASGWDNTEITRIALENGTVIPEASCEVKGYVKNQFSMSEYNGFFRVATTEESWNENWTDELFGRSAEWHTNNSVFVFDMDLNEVGSITGFGADETIKSVNFAGDLAYVVTYEQTDPLFAIDLTDPSAPVILDEFKITGYSTYMQQWDDGRLLGFGVSATEDGIENGVKLVMFDNSDPNNLQEIGLYSVTKPDDISYIYSYATWERKALLIAPEKNLIGVPVTIDEYGDDYYNSTNKYMFFSYSDGEFTLKGEIAMDGEAYCDRAVYIGDYVYVLSSDKFVAADIESITPSDETIF